MCWTRYSAVAPGEKEEKKGMKYDGFSDSPEKIVNGVRTEQELWIMSQTFSFCVAAEHKVFPLRWNSMPGYYVSLITRVLGAKFLDAEHGKLYSC